MKEKKKAKAAAEAAKLEAAKKAQEELFRGMSKAERKAHEVAERHRKQEEEQGMEVAGGFGKTTVNYQKRKLEEEEKERIRRHKQWVKDMKMIEPVLQRREIREMSVEDTASAVFSRLENRARHYQELVEAETARQVRLKEEQALAAEEHEKMIEPGFSFNRGKFKDAHKNKPTEGRLIKRFKGHKLPVKRVFFDDSGEYLVTCGMDKLIKVWSIKSEECVHAFSGHRHGVTCCSILGTYGAKRNASSKTPKGKRRRPYTPTDTEMPTVVVKKKQFRVMSGDGSGSVFFWVEGSERCVLQRQVHDAVIYDCAFSPREHGRWAMSCSEDSTMRVIDSINGNLLCQFRGTHGAVTACAWSPNGHIAVTGGGFADTCIRLWDVTNAVIFMHILKKEFAEAIDIFERKVSDTGIGMWPTFDTLNALVEVYMRHADPQIGCIVFEEMMSRGMKPTPNVVALIRCFLQTPTYFWDNERIQQDYDSNEEDSDEESSSDEDNEKEAQTLGSGNKDHPISKEPSRAKTGKGPKDRAESHESSKSRGDKTRIKRLYDRGTHGKKKRPSSASAITAIAQAQASFRLPKYTDHSSADAAVAFQLLHSADNSRKQRPTSAPGYTSLAVGKARLANLLETEERLGPVTTDLNRFARSFVLSTLHTVISRAEFVHRKKLFLNQARLKREEEDAIKAQSGTLGRFNATKLLLKAEEDARNARPPFIKLSKDTEPSDLMLALGRLHTEVTGHFSLFEKRRLYQGLNFRVSAGHEVDGDGDPRAKKAMIVRFERQKRRAKRLRKHLDRAIFHMDKVLDRAMGTQPWITDVPDGGGGTSTFLLRQFDRSRGHGEWVNAVKFTPDGRYILSAGSDNNIKVWDPQDGSMLQTLGPHPGWVNCISIMPKGDWIIAGSEDLLIVWNFNLVLARIKDEEELKEKKKHMSLLVEISSRITSKKEMSQIFEDVISDAHTLLHADRATLFIFDQKKFELYSEVAVGIPPIRLPADSGICGFVATTGQPLNIEDAWKDERFNPSFDKKNGYRTKTVLCMPLHGEEWDKKAGAMVKQVVGVIQIINKLDGTNFSADDEVILSQFCTQLSVAVRNCLRLSKADMKKNRILKKKKKVDLLVAPPIVSDLDNVIFQPLRAAYTMRGHCDLVYHVDVSPDCRRISSGSHDMNLCIWQVVPGIPDRIYGRPFPTEVKTTSMRINWTVPSENGQPITGYRLVRRLEESHDFGDEIMIPHCNSPYGFVDKTRSYLLKHLRPGTVYEFKLAPVNAIGSGPFSKPMIARRTATTVPLQVMGRPEVIEKKARSCVLRWNSPMSFGTAVTSFRIQMRGGKIFHFGDVEDLTISMRDAQAVAVKYRNALKKRAEKIKKQSSEWGKYGRRINHVPPPPVLMSKDGPSGPPRKEDLELGQVPEVAVEIKDLTPGEIYMFRVTGYNKKGEGEFSLSSYSIVTNALPPARMVPPFPEEITPFSARMRFIAPNTNGNIIEEYRLFYGECGDDKTVESMLKVAERNLKKLPDPDYDPFWLKATRFDVEKQAKKLMPVMVGKIHQKYSRWADMIQGTVFDIDGLAPGTNYMFAVTAKNAQGYGDCSPVSKLVRTKCAPPAPPRQPFADSIESTSMVLNFAVPEGNGSKVTAMKVLILEGGGEQALYRPEILLQLGDAKVCPDGVLPFGAICVDPRDPGRSYKYRIGQLIGDQIYKFKVAGINEEGMGSFSLLSPQSVTLPPIPPSVPCEKITVDEVTNESVTMHWSKSVDDGGSPIAGYIIAARAFGGQTKTSTEGSKEEGKQDGGKVIVPDGYEIIGSTGPSITKFLFTKPRIRAFYTFRVSCYNHVGQSDFTESPESIQVPSKVEYIAKLQKQKMEQIAEEKKRRAYAKKLQLGGEKEKVNIEE